MSKHFSESVFFYFDFSNISQIHLFFLSFVLLWQGDFPCVGLNKVYVYLPQPGEQKTLCEEETLAESREAQSSYSLLQHK